MTTDIRGKFGQMDLNALDERCSLRWKIELTEDLDLCTRNHLEPLKAAYVSRFGSCRDHVGVVVPFDSCKIIRGEWSLVRTCRLTDRNGDNVHEVNFYVTEGVVPYKDPEGEKPIEGRPGLEVRLLVKRIDP